MAKELTPPYRVGKRLGRAVLDSKGILVVVFPIGKEEQAQEYCDFLNRDHKECREQAIDFAKWIADKKYRDNGETVKFTLVDNNWYFDTDADGNQPLTEERLYEMYKIDNTPTIP